MLPFAALVISALVAYRLSQPPQPKFIASPNEISIPAPLFQLFDQESKFFRLASYLGRHQIVIRFYVAPEGIAEDQAMLALRDEFPRIDKTNAKLLTISAATPYANRESIKKCGPFPFPLLSDPTLQIHEAWGAIRSDERTPLPATFLIDRAGRIRRMHVGPDETPSVDQILEELAEIR